MRIAARVDSNQKEIVTALRKLGYSVLHTHQLKNCFDILVGYKGKNYAFEIKDEKKPPSQKKLTKGEKIFFDGWKGQVNKVETIEEITAIIYLADHIGSGFEIVDDNENLKKHIR